jgi:hypothetical protein
MVQARAYERDAQTLSRAIIERLEKQGATDEPA